MYIPLSVFSVDASLYIVRVAYITTRSCLNMIKEVIFKIPAGAEGPNDYTHVDVNILRRSKG